MIEHQEIERKYLIRRPDENELAKMPGCVVHTLQQVYLKALRNNVRRLRIVETNGETKYFFTEKRNITDLAFRELEREISLKEYNMMLDDADFTKKPLCKTRYSIPEGSHVLDIDIYSFWQNQAILEVGLTSEDDDFAIPEWIHVIRNVTGEHAYRNSVLAGQVPAEE